MTHYTQTIPESIEADIVSTFFNYRYCRSLTYGKAFDLLAKVRYEVEVHFVKNRPQEYEAVVYYNASMDACEERYVKNKGTYRFYTSDWCEAANRGLELAIEMYNKNNQQ